MWGLPKLEPELSRSHIKRNGHVLINLVPGEPEMGDGQKPGTHSSKPRLLSKFQTTVKDVKRPCLKRQGGQHQRSYSQG